MKIKWLFILLFSFCNGYSALYAQPYFNNRYYYYNDRLNLGTEAIQDLSNYLVVGEVSTDTNYYWSAISIMKLDNLGNPVWEKYYGGDSGTRYYTTERGNSAIIKTFDGNYVVPGGEYIFYNNNNSRYEQMLLYKFDKNGDTLWVRRYVQDMADTEESCEVCKQTNDRGFIIAGILATRANNNFGTPSVLLVKTDSLGRRQWQKVFGSNAEGWSVALTRDGGYIIGGMNNGLNDYYLIKTDVLGNTEWQKNYSNGGGGSPAMVCNTNGGYMFAGGYCTYINSPDYYYRINVVKVDSAGNVLWSKYYGPTVWGFGPLQSPVESCNGVYTFPNYPIIDSSNNVVYSVVFRVDSVGDSISWNNYSNITSAYSQNYLTSIMPTSDSGFIACGFGWADTGREFIWVLKLPADSLHSCGLITTGVPQLNPAISGNELRIEPNPNNGVFALTLPSPSGEGVSFVEIYNMLGQQVYDEMLKPVQHDYKIDLSSHPAGIYLYRVVTDKGKLVGDGKFVIER